MLSIPSPSNLVAHIFELVLLWKGSAQPVAIKGVYVWKEIKDDQVAHRYTLHLEQTGTTATTVLPPTITVEIIMAQADIVNAILNANL